MLETEPSPPPPLSKCRSYFAFLLMRVGYTVTAGLTSLRSHLSLGPLMQESSSLEVRASIA